MATFEFSMNGEVVQWNGPGGGTAVCVLCGPHLTDNSTYFTLSSSAPQNFAEALVIRIHSSTISLATYSDTISAAVDSTKAVHWLYTPSLKAAATEEGDYASVTFTNIKDEMYYDGNFRAKLTLTPFGANASKLEIVGSFRNVRRF